MIVRRIVMAGFLAASVSSCGWVDVQSDGERPPTAVQRDGAIEVVDGERTVVARPGDTLYGLAARFDATPNQLIALNNLNRPYDLSVGQRLVLPAEQTLHRVQAGDTLGKIARDYDVPLGALASANALRDPYPLRVGEVIGVPKSGRSLASRPAPRPAARSTAPERSGGGVQVSALPETKPAPAPQSSSAATEPARPAAKPAPKPAPSAKRVPPARSVAKAPAVAEPAAPPAPAKPTVSAPAVATPGRKGGFLAPIDGPVIAKFGSQADGRRNDGVNIAAPKGAPVRAAAAGEVVYAGDALQGYGNLILVRHSDGWVTAYAHLDRILAKRGEKVTRGQAIGAVGATGGVSTPQLHFEMRKDNRAVDPVGRLSTT